MAITKNTSNNKILTRMWGKRHITNETTLVQPLWKAVWRFLRKLGMEPLFDPVIPLLDLHANDLKSAYYSDKATLMFIAVQFTIAKLWNQHICLSTDEWIKKM